MCCESHLTYNEEKISNTEVIDSYLNDIMIFTTLSVSVIVKAVAVCDCSLVTSQVLPIKLYRYQTV